MSAYREMDDQPLVALVKAGNHDAFAELVTRYTDRFMAVAYRTLQSKGDAEDVVQTAFVKFWERPQLWNSDKAQFTTWFYRVVMNACHDLLRKSNRSVEAEPSFLESRQTPVDSEQTELEQKQFSASRQHYLEVSIRALPSSQRDALNLVVYCELPQRQVADIMGISLKAVESLLVRAKRSLTKHVAELEAAANRNEVNYGKS